MLSSVQARAPPSRPEENTAEAMESYEEAMTKYLTGEVTPGQMLYVVDLVQKQVAKITTKQSTFEGLTANMYPEDPKAWAKFCKENIFGNNPPSTTSALLAFRLVHASQHHGVSHKDMANVMAQIAFDSKRMQILSQGCDFFNNTYQAEVSCLTGHLLVDHEDYAHKSKNCVSQLRAQCGDDAALSKSADSQNVPIVEAFLYDQGLQVNGEHRGSHAKHEESSLCS
eukprot:gene12103-15217_t